MSTTTQSGYSTDYKLCYSSDIQRLVGMMRKNGFDEKHPDTVALLNTLSMSIKKWQAPTGFYYVLKYTKNVFQPMYPPDMSCVSQKLSAIDASRGISGNTDTDTDSKEASIQGRGLFRSIVLDRDGNVVSYSPAKTVRCNDASDLDALNELSTSEFFSTFSHIEEFVEGTMFHLFRSPGTSGSGSGNARATSTEPDALSLSGWEISTKGVVGAGVFVPAPATTSASGDGVKPTPVTFRSLFLKACIANKIDLTTLNPNYCYSLVLQHPNNPIIAPIVEPRLYYIAAYTIDNDTLTVTRHARDAIDWKGAGFHVPKNYAHGLVNPVFPCLQMKYVNPCGTTPYRVMGVMFHSSSHSGWSFKLRNPAYEAAKKTPMEMQTRLFYTYCSLRRSRELKQHLALFPEDTVAFNAFNERILKYAQHVYDAYVDCFILKKTSHALCSSKYVKAILHGVHKDIFCARKDYQNSLAASSSEQREASGMEMDTEMEMSETTGKPRGQGHKVKVRFCDVLHYITNIISPIDLFSGANMIE